MSKKYKRILVANRGEIAVRIIRACRELGIETVSIYSKADKDSLHTRLSDISVCIGSNNCKDSYLNAYNILSTAVYYKVDAIHPGIGFLAENPDFAELCSKLDIDYIGASRDTIALMGDKIEAKKIVKACGIPVVGDSSVEVNNEQDCREYIKENGYPVILKASNGGGGRGIRVVYNEDDLKQSLELCKMETQKNFGDCKILIEKYIVNAKHIEVQILADKYGNVIHLGDRECSIQRKNQKLIEEARCTTLTDAIREEIYKNTVDLCKKIGYVGAGTVEFLLEDDGSFYFMEMNTRLQVEHTITELITGIDIVKQQIRIAEGDYLPFKQEDISFNGYAIQCRILAEYYNGSFIPDNGKITKWNMPGGFGVRVDSGYEVNNTVSTYYDSLLCKICIHGQDKSESVRNMICSLMEMQVEDISTNKDLLISILKDQSFLNGKYTTNYIEQKISRNMEDLNNE